MTLPIDLDTATICFEGNWVTRDDLARRIKGMLEAGDFAVTKPSQALEQLTHTLAATSSVEVKLTAGMLESLSQAAARQSKSVGALIRHAIARNLLDDANALAEAEAADSANAPHEGWVVRDSTRRPRSESEPLPGPATSVLLAAAAVPVPVVQGTAEVSSGFVTEAANPDDLSEPVELKPKRRSEANGAG